MATSSTSSDLEVELARQLEGSPSPALRFSLQQQQQPPKNARRAGRLPNPRSALGAQKPLPVSICQGPPVPPPCKELQDGQVVVHIEKTREDVAAERRRRCTPCSLGCKNVCICAIGLVIVIFALVLTLFTDGIHRLGRNDVLHTLETSWVCVSDSNPNDTTHFTGQPSMYSGCQLTPQPVQPFNASAVASWTLACEVNCTLARPDVRPVHFNLWPSAQEGSLSSSLNSTVSLIPQHLRLACAAAAEPPGLSAVTDYLTVNVTGTAHDPSLPRQHHEHVVYAQSVTMNVSYSEQTGLIPAGSDRFAMFNFALHRSTSCKGHIFRNRYHV